MAEVKFTVAPGVSCHRHSWGDWVTGEREAVIACGLIEPEWLSDCTERRGKRNHVIRTRETMVGGLRVKTTVTALGTVDIRIDSPLDETLDWRRLAERQTESYNGNTKVAWSDCAWQPGQNKSRQLLAAIVTAIEAQERRK